MKIAVLLSGGVDSSVALRLLKDEGHDLTAFYLKIWLEKELSFLGDCPWEEDLDSARAVCKQADIPLEILSLQHEYWNSVVAYTIDEVQKGRTPNPDMFCNKLVKFGQFYDKIDESFEEVATGHYAQIRRDNGGYRLKKAPDPIKDQTYFLAYLTTQQLARACFPLGKYTKNQVRDLAQKYNLPNKNRKDSQGICFLGQIRFDEFVRQHLGEKKGELFDIDTEEKVGEHRGYWFYTIGQRRGLGLSGGPWYVVKKDVKQNIIYISREYDLHQKRRNSFVVSDFNWISGKKPEKEYLQVKIRHGESWYNCKLEFTDEDTAKVKLDEPDQGIATGQFAVFYDEDTCLGGGIIT